MSVWETESVTDEFGGVFQPEAKPNCTSKFPSDGTETISPLTCQSTSVVSFHRAPASTAADGTMLTRMEPAPVGSGAKLAVMVLSEFIVTKRGFAFPDAASLQPVN